MVGSAGVRETEQDCCWACIHSGWEHWPPGIPSYVHTCLPYNPETLSVPSAAPVISSMGTVLVLEKPGREHCMVTGSFFRLTNEPENWLPPGTQMTMYPGVWDLGGTELASAGTGGGCAAL